MRKFIISSSILSANFAKLGDDINKVISAGVDMIHFDVMDNHYVPNLTIGPMVLKSLRAYGISVPIDVHFMIKPVDNLIPYFAEAGATFISFHPEASNHIDRSLQLIKKYGCKAGLAFNPATPLNWIEYELENLDLILLMSVNPGFYGQPFIQSTVRKLTEARKIIDESGMNINLQVDGGITLNNIRSIANAGADIFVIGSTIFKNNNYKKIIKAIKNELLKIK